MKNTMQRYEHSENLQVLKGFFPVPAHFLDINQLERRIFHEKIWLIANKYLSLHSKTKHINR